MDDHKLQILSKKNRSEIAFCLMKNCDNRAKDEDKYSASHQIDTIMIKRSLFHDTTIGKKGVYWICSLIS